jgi:hypothetical protein
MADVLLISQIHNARTEVQKRTNIKQYSRPNSDKHNSVSGCDFPSVNNVFCQFFICFF